MHHCGSDAALNLQNNESYQINVASKMCSGIIK